METITQLRVATYNVHGCVGTDGRRSESRIAKVIAGLDADIVGLQELDLNRRRSAGADQAGLIAERLGWTRFFHPAMRRAEEEYGDAILSRHPMVLRKAAMLPCDAPFYCRETRAALWVDVTTPIGNVHVFNTHFGLGRAERLTQAHLLVGKEWLGSVPGSEPAIVMGDFNSTPKSGPFRVLSGALRYARSFARPALQLKSFPSNWPLFEIDHIFVNDQLSVETIEVVRSARDCSDHLPVMAIVRRVG